MSLLKIEKAVGVALAVLLMIVTLFSTIYFLSVLKIDVIDWIAFNSCSPVSFFYLCCFVIFINRKKATCLGITALPVYFLGTLSMFAMPWTGTYLFAHFGHIIMTMNLLWVFYVLLKYRDYKALALGLTISILLFAPYIAYVLAYNQEHSVRMAELLKV